MTFQRDLEAQYKSQLETELSLYKSRELAKVRMEEREKYQQELASERVGATVAHQKKIEELRKTEQQMMDRYRKKEQVSYSYSTLTLEPNVMSGNTLCSLLPLLVCRIWSLVSTPSDRLSWLR